MKTGLVIGKFLPPHQGHLYLVRFAESWVRKLYVVVESVRNEPIEHKLRLEWMRELCPECEIVPLYEQMPQSPSEHPDFWQLWENKLLAILPEAVDLVFASEPYGKQVAGCLNAEFVPVDCDREGQPISATAIRTDPHRNWAMLTPPVRRFLQVKVCIVGPESTGKSTLAQRLATRYDGQVVPEFARGYLKFKNSKPDYGDMTTIARGQSASEKAILALGSPVVFCDTDPLSTLIWSEWFFSRHELVVHELAQRHSYDLTLLLDVDVPWVDDPIRYAQDDRLGFMTRFVEKLSEFNRPFVRLSGDWDNRFDVASQKVESILASQIERLFWQP